MRSSRRGFLAQALVLAALPLAAAAQGVARRPRIGCLTPSDPMNENQKQFRRGLRDAGYTEDENISLEYRFGMGRNDRLREFATELVRLNVDMLFTAGTEATAAAKAATATIPIVSVSGDPVGSGFAASLGRPGGNITGLAIATPELSTKWIELVREVVPRVSRTGVLQHRADGGPQLRLLEPAARQVGVDLVVVTIQRPEEIPSAFDRFVRARAEAVIPLSSPVFAARRDTLVALAGRHRLPAVYEQRLFVDPGGLLSYGPDFGAIFHRAASYVDRILKGARPAELPIEQATKFELAINVATATALGLSVPPTLRLRADHVIE